MIYDGIKFRRAYHLGWRYGDPESDVDCNGDPIRSTHVVIVKIKDCRIYIEGSKKHYDPAGVKEHVKLDYSSSNMGYGKSRYYKRRNLITCPIYLVSDGAVFRGTFHTRVAVEGLFNE